MNAAAIDKQINEYLVQLSPKQKMAVLTVVKTFVAKPEEDLSPWKNADFVAVMDRRIAELENGKAKGYDWEEMKKRTHHWSR